MKGTLRIMHKKIKFKGPSGFMVECSFVFLTLITLAIFIRMRKIRNQNLNKSLLYPTQKNNAEIIRKAFVLFLIKRRTFFGTPGRH